MTPAEITICREAIAQHSKSFALAARVLPKGSRDDAAVVYAWCRRADDAIDLAPEQSQPHAIVALRRELRSVCDGEPQADPTLAAFQAVVRRRGIPEEYPAALLDGMEMDVLGTRYERLETLLLYCFRVAGTVGLMMCHVMGVSCARALRHAAHLGIAMQLTNICRDVEEDRQRRRLYIPADVLADSGAMAEAPYGGARPDRTSHATYRRAIERLLAIADDFYRSGDRGLAFLSWRARLAVRTARLVYSAIGWRIRQRGHDVWSARAVVPSALKAVLVLVSAFWAVVELPAALFPRFRAAPLARAVEYPRDVLPL